MSDEAAEVAEEQKTRTVVATKRGFYGGRLRVPEHPPFEVAEADFSATWMEDPPAAAEAAEETAEAPQKGRRQKKPPADG